MDWQLIHTILSYIQHLVSLCGILIIVLGVVYALTRFLMYARLGRIDDDSGNFINSIRLHLGRTLILGLEFIVAADLIGTTTTPDYYAVGLLAIIVMVRTLLTFSINKEISSLEKK